VSPGAAAGDGNGSDAKTRRRRDRDEAGRDGVDDPIESSCSLASSFALLGSALRAELVTPKAGVSAEAFVIVVVVLLAVADGEFDGIDGKEKPDRVFKDEKSAGRLGDIGLGTDSSGSLSKDSKGGGGGRRIPELSGIGLADNRLEKRGPTCSTYSFIASLAFLGRVPRLGVDAVPSVSPDVWLR
jgi:hypothetical protein